MDMRTKVDELAELLETHYRPTLTNADYKELRVLDDLAIDEELTQARFDKTKAKLMLNRRRSYEINPATLRVDEAYWSATNDKGVSNLARRAPIRSKRGSRAQAFLVKQFEQDVAYEEAKTLKKLKQHAARQRLAQ